MIKLAKITTELFRQANRLLTNMVKRAANDSNVQHALDLAHEDIDLFSKGKSTKFGVNSSMNEKNLKSMVRAAEQLLDSPYSRQKSTDALYRQQRKTFGERYGLTPKQTKKIVDLFDAKKNPKTAEAWNSIKDKVEYNAIVPHLRDGKLADVTNDLGTKKLGLMMRYYIESGISRNMDFIEYLSNEDYYKSFANNNIDTLNRFLDNESLRPHLLETKDIISDIGQTNFDYFTKMFDESGLSDEISFDNFVNDNDYYSFFKNMDLETIKDFVDNKLYEG